MRRSPPRYGVVRAALLYRLLYAGAVLHCSSSLITFERRRSSPDRC
ncbi:hypothetical protein [Modestobacter excelsi]|nr:hypothetical protein [Modestobacter excelsi]